MWLLREYPLGSASRVLTKSGDQSAFIDSHFGAVESCALPTGKLHGIDLHLRIISSDEAVETAKQLALQEGWLNMTANLKAHAVKNHLWTLTIRQSSFGSKCEISQEFLKKVSKSGIVESHLSWANFKQSKDLKKTDGTKRQRITGNTKLDDANDARGKSSDKCTLILTEGVSAKALVIEKEETFTYLVCGLAIGQKTPKDKGRDDKSGVAIQDILQEESLADERKDFTIEDAELVLENSDVSDSVDCLPEMQSDSEDRDTDTSEVHPPTEASSSVVSGLSTGQNGIRQTNSSSVVDDSSSTCSTDSVPSVVMNGSYKGERNQRGKATCDATNLANEDCILAPEPSRDVAQPNDASESYKAKSESETVVYSLQDRIKKLEQHVVKMVASKGRTGLMVSAYLVYSGMSAEEALQVPYITTALMDAKLGTKGRKDLFDWLSRQLSGLSNFPNAVNLNYVLFQIVMRDGCDL
ncbi:hypothetical protein HYC85_006125 [Camellia sinensis]|uniref:Uncharacterized protein n=1 Tax=Camellia sinensis TaxID=4442 RepID=A0A7J7I1G7_CAMSI|nr:hypothetical protein HYC85_006125 [Camellia sinensis]